MCALLYQLNIKGPYICLCLCLVFTRVLVLVVVRVRVSKRGFVRVAVRGSGIAGCDNGMAVTTWVNLYRPTLTTLGCTVVRGSYTMQRCVAPWCTVLYHASLRMRHHAALRCCIVLHHNLLDKFDLELRQKMICRF